MGTLIESSGDITLTPNNAASMSGGSVVLSPAPATGFYNAPLRWGNGSKYSLGAGTILFNGTPDNSGSIGYNLQKIAGDVSYGLGFEADYDALPLARTTEFYYYWNGIEPAEVGARRPLQINVSNGLGTGNPDPAGFTNVGFHANKFFISSQGNYSNNGLALDFTPAVPTLGWHYNATIDGTLTVGNTFTMNGQFQSNFPGTGNGVPGLLLMPNMGSAPNFATLYLGKTLTGSGNAAQWTWENYGTNSVNNAFSFGFAGIGGKLRVTADGTVAALATTDATTAGAASLKTSGGIYSAKGIVGATFVTATTQFRSTYTTAATTLGNVVKKMEIFDAAGTSLGFIPIYDAIT